MTISEAFSHYLEDVVIFRNLSVKTEESYTYAKKSFIRNIGDIDLEDLRFEQVRRWKSKTTHLKPNTFRNYVCCLRQVIKHSRANYRVTCLLEDAIPVPKREENNFVWFTSKEISNLIKIVGKPKARVSKVSRLRTQFILSLLFSTGIRVSELCSIDRKDIKLDTISIKGKNQKIALKFIDYRTKQLILDYLETRNDNNPWLICSANGTRIRSSDIQRLFVRLRKIPGYEKLHPHAIRHSYATDLLSNNCNLFVIKELMGHSDVNSTARYLHAQNPDLKEAHERYHSV